MKNMTKTFVRLAAVALAAVATAACALAQSPRSLKVLMIGNSFSICLLKQLPQCVAAAPGCELDLCSLYIGGCSLETHWRNVERSAADPAFRPYGIQWNYHGVANAADAPVAAAAVKGRSSIQAALAADRWDVVTVQQASHFSWRPETYEPFGGNLLKTVRELAPQARVMVQETWAYTPFDGRLAKWGIDQKEMYASIEKAYASFAARHGLPVIPTGAAVQRFRRRFPSPDGITGDPCGSPTGNDKFHLNREGEYLQACVWLSALYGFDARKIAYRPPFLDEARAAAMRDCAMARD